MTPLFHPKLKDANSPSLSLLMKRKLRRALPPQISYPIIHHRRLRALPTLVRKAIRNLAPTDICIDCGANVGEISSLFAKNGATVYAFEPNPHAYQILERIAKDYPTIIPRQQAVGTSNHSCIPLYFRTDHLNDPVGFSQSSSLISDKPNLTEAHVNVEMIDLAELLSTLSTVRFLKIDIEGYEVKLLNALLARCALGNVEMILVETHEANWPEMRQGVVELKRAVAESGLAQKFFWNWF